MVDEVVLGNKVRDRVTGFEGIAVSRHSYLQGCDRMSVQPPVDRENKLPDFKTFDEPDLEFVDNGVAGDYPQQKETGRRPGGPHGPDPEPRSDGGLR